MRRVGHRNRRSAVRSGRDKRSEKLAGPVESREKNEGRGIQGDCAALVSGQLSRLSLFHSQG